MFRILVPACCLLPLLLGACAPILADAPHAAEARPAANARPAADAPLAAAVPAAATAPVAAGVRQSALQVDRDDAPLPAPLREALGTPGGVDFLLLGEIHDHPLHHRLRARWLEELAGQGRFVLAVEQLDADRQPALDDARRAADRAQESAGGAAGSASGAGAGGPQGADRALRLARAAGFDFRGWHWPFYAPYVELALRRGLPLAAVNLSNEQTRRIARGETHPLAGAQPPGWSAAEHDAMAAEIRDGHCGMLPESAIAPMAAAQVARDAQMARALVDARRASGLPVVLLAGNGHVRADLGVPRHLAGLAPGARVLSVGFVEPGGPLPAFDLSVLTPVHERPDPCEAMRRTMR